MFSLEKLIFDYFEPCNPEDATLTLTTVHIHNRVDSFAPGKFSLEQVYEFMCEKGYLFENIDMELSWALKDRNS